MVWTDTHAHLADETLLPLLEPLLEKAKTSGVSRILCVAVDAKSSSSAVRLAETHSHIWASVGIHPNYAHLASPSDWDRVRDLANHPRVCALGETGLDLHWDDCPFAVQKENFARHFELSRATELPLVIHMRDCESEMLGFLREQSNQGVLRGVMHSFSGATETARSCLDLGLYISFAGMLTYKKSQPLRETAATIPIDRVLLETDCPYLSPEPYRSKRPNEPANVIHTAKCLAETMGVSMKELAKATAENVECLFWRMKQT